MEYPVHAVLPAAEPPVSVIIPYREGKVFNPVYVCVNDEVLVVEGGESIGHARIEGARHAANEWLLMMDSDAVYPKDYVPLVKSYIRRYGSEYPVMSARRRGGFGNTFTKYYESGLIVRKDVFLSRTECYPFGLVWRGRRTDVWGYFEDAVPIDVTYYHDFTTDEKKLLASLFVIPAVFVSLLYL